MDDENRGMMKWTILGIVTVCVLVVGSMVGCPHYRVWNQEMIGRAELSRAEQNRQIRVVTAEAQLQVEELNAQMEVVRAKGAAEAMKAVQDSLTSEYLLYRFILTFGQHGNQVIYIPTDGVLPILEAGRLGR